VPPPQGTKAFQVPTSFSGITVVDQDFVNRAHSDGYGVHVWTINDEKTMNQLLDWKVDGIMSAEPMRLEKVLCGRGEKRPALPASSPGKHCNKSVSIACDVDPTKVRVRGGTAKAIGAKSSRKGSFNFRWKPPSEGGPGTRVAEVELSRKLAKSIRRSGRVRARAHPYGGFVSRAVLDAS
jgi:hypothetical protein